MIAGVANSDPVRARVARPAQQWLRASPGSFYACLFLLTFQIAVLFGDGRDVASLLYRLISARL